MVYVGRVGTLSLGPLKAGLQDVGTQGNLGLSCPAWTSAAPTCIEGRD